MKKYIIPIVIPYSSDKKDWIVDNQKVLGKKQEKIDKEFVEKTVNAYLERKPENSEVEVAFIGADFTNLEEGLQEEVLDCLLPYIQDGRVNGIRVSMRPDSVRKEKLKMLKKHKVKTIELEVYSTNDYILKRIGMSYTFKDIKKVSRKIRFSRFKLGHQVYIGLPDSTKIDDINTAKNLTKLKTSVVDINPVLVIKDTPLEKEYQEKQYKPLAVIQALETCKEMVKIFNERNVEISAIGFEPLDSEVEQQTFVENVIEGPFHPAFRELVESGLWYDAIVNKIKKLNTKVMEVEVTVNPADINNVVGYKKENIEKLKNTYDVDLIVTENENMKQGKSKIEITKVFNWGE